MAAIIAGTKLGFRAGTQSSLDALIGVNNNSGTPGIFYLTTDSHRLYVCDDDSGQINPVNEGITFVNNISDLPNLTTMTDAQRKNMQGQFYYVGGTSNILCVASGSNWVQINPDTWYQLDASNGVKNTLTDNSVAGGNKVATFTVKVRENKVTGGNVDTSDYLENSDTFTIEASPSAGMTIDSSNKKIIFSPPAGAKYDLTGENKNGGGVTLKLTGSDNSEDLVHIVSAAGTAVQASIASGTSTASGTVHTITLQGEELGLGSSFVTTQNASGALVSTITSSTGTTLSSTPIKYEINYGETTTTASGTLSNGTLSFNVDAYTKDETDEKIASELKSFEGMYFAGTVGNSSATYATIGAIAAQIPKPQNGTGLRSGATFKAATDITGHTTPALDGLGSNGTIKAGDLIIVVGDEDENGYLDGNNLTYYYVPSGNDDDQWYRPNFATANEINITGADSSSYKYTFAQGNDGVTVVASGTPSSSAQTLAFSHKTNANVSGTSIASSSITSGTVTQAYDGTGSTFKAIDDVTVDSYGHITGLSTKEITFIHNGIATNGFYNIASTLTPASGTGVKLTGHIVDRAGADTSDKGIEYTSQSLQITNIASGTTTTAPNVGIEIVWGSF